MRELDFLNDYEHVKEDECRELLDMAMRWCSYADSIGAPRKAFRKSCIQGLKAAFEFVFQEYEDAKITMMELEEGDDES